MMRTKKLLIAGGLVVALAVPAGVAVAATDSPAPDAPEMTQPDRPGFGPHGRMMDRFGEPQECPLHDSDAMREWREQRDKRWEQRDDWRQRHRDQHQQFRQEMHERLGSQRAETG